MIRVRYQPDSDDETYSAMGVRADADGTWYDFSRGDFYARSQCVQPYMGVTQLGAGELVTANLYTPANVWHDGLYWVVLRTPGGEDRRQLIALLSDGLDESDADFARPREASIADILYWIRAKLIDDGVYTNAQCEVSLADEQFPVSGPHFCNIQPSYMRDSAIQIGSERYATELDGTIQVKCYQRRQSDVAYADNRALAGRGAIVRKVERTVGSLTGRMPEYSSGDTMVTEPLRIQGQWTPRRYRRSPEWIYVVLTMSVRYLPRIRAGEWWDGTPVRRQREQSSSSGA